VTTAPVPVPAPAWVEDTGALARIVERIVQRPAYAIDTEFHRERTYWPKLALVQLAWHPDASGDRDREDDAEPTIALVDPLAVDDLSPLADLLQSDALAVLHAADQDLEVLDVACGGTPRRLFDTQIAAGFLGFSSPSLATLCDRLLGRRMTKGDRLTDWTQRPLTDAQKRYAADDVAHLLDLHAKLTRRLAKVGRLEWATEECAAMLARPRQPQDPDTAWWRIKESRSLRGPTRGVAAAVAAWRERRAAEVDRPPRTVLSDLAILGIAHRQPRTVDDLKGIRGFDARSLREAAARELLAVVERGRNIKPSDIETPPTDDLDRRLRPAATLAAAWVGQLAQDLRIDAALLATRNDLHAFLRGAPGARLARGWRNDIVGERVRLLVDGNAALAFRAGKGDLVLERRSGEDLAPVLPVPDEDVELAGPEDDGLVAE
jgi:ribonuclease D